VDDIKRRSGLWVEDGWMGRRLMVSLAGEGKSPRVRMIGGGRD
jgi:hypothetical protein